VKGLLEGMIASAPSVFPKWGISSDIVVAHVTGKFGEECGGGAEMQENMNYSAARLLQVFPAHFNCNQSVRCNCPRFQHRQPYQGKQHRKWRAFSKRSWAGRHRRSND
jgi:putative chitinase